MPDFPLIINAVKITSPDSNTTFHDIKRDYSMSVLKIKQEFIQKVEFHVKDPNEAIKHAL